MILFTSRAGVPSGRPRRQRTRRRTLLSRRFGLRPRPRLLCIRLIASLQIRISRSGVPSKLLLGCLWRSSSLLRVCENFVVVVGCSCCPPWYICNVQRCTSDGKAIQPKRSKKMLEVKLKLENKRLKRARSGNFYIVDITCTCGTKRTVEFRGWCSLICGVCGAVGRRTKLR